MRLALGLCLFILFVVSCNKENNNTTPFTCDIQQVYADNAEKVTIENGVWGTVSSIEGNCMPTLTACISCCRNCPVKRTVKIYQFTTLNDAVTSDPNKIFFEAFNTLLIMQIDTDEEGFFQADIPPGYYTIVVVENGKLYANLKDGQDGISPLTLTSGIKNFNLTMTYKAAF